MTTTASLLLAAGAQITSDVRRMLKQRDLQSISVSEKDQGSVTLTVTPSILAANDTMPFDSVVATQLDKLIDSGLLTLQNSGPAMKQQVVYHGRKAYDLDKHATLRDQRVATGESLNNMMKEALHGRNVSGTVVNQLAASYLADMADDTDCVLSSALEASQDQSLADHCFRMSMLATAIAMEMGMNDENCRRVCVAGMVHDWGMAKVPSEVRNANRLVSKLESLSIKKHPIYTADILEKMPGIPSMVPLIAYQVHERPNGQGHPLLMLESCGLNPLLLRRWQSVLDLKQVQPMLPATFAFDGSTACSRSSAAESSRFRSRRSRFSA